MGTHYLGPARVSLSALYTGIHGEDGREGERRRLLARTASGSLTASQPGRAVFSFLRTHAAWLNPWWLVWSRSGFDNLLLQPPGIAKNRYLASFPVVLKKKKKGRK